MRREPNIRVEQWRRVHPTLGGSPEGVNWGYFEFANLRIISSGTPANYGDSQWEHVSVSCANRCPTWDEMQKVKEMFWTDDESVVQFHPPASEYVNYHPYCLHLWRRVVGMIPTPPIELIGPMRSDERKRVE